MLNWGMMIFIKDFGKVPLWSITNFSKAPNNTVHYVNC
jgi:hypothetical protein